METDAAFFSACVALVGLCRVLAYDEFISFKTFLLNLKLLVSQF